MNTDVQVSRMPLTFNVVMEYLGYCCDLIAFESGVVCVVDVPIWLSLSFLGIHSRC